MIDFRIPLLQALLLAALVSAAGATWPPQEWTAYGPFMQEQMTGGRGLPDPAALAPTEALRGIPEELTFGGRTFVGRKVSTKNGVLDLEELFDGAERGKTVHLMTTVDVPEPTVLRMGAGADWFMQWWLDGEPIYDTLTTGNRHASLLPTDHVFEVPLSEGTHVLAVAVIGGSSGLRLALGDPDAEADELGDYEADMAAAQAVYASENALRQDPPIDFPLARKHLEKALQAASTDSQRAQALLALGENLLADPWERDFSSIRDVFLSVLALENPGPDARRIRAEALRGVAETWLREENYDQARLIIREAFGASDDQRDLEDAQLLLARSWMQQREFGNAQRELDRLISMQPRREELLWQARALKSAMELAPAVRADHPRLFFNADSWPEIKDRALTVRKDYQDTFRARVNGLKAEDLLAMPSGAEPMQRIMETAFLWQVTGDENYLRQTQELLTGTGPALFHGTNDDGNRLFNRGSPFVAWIAALDWTWNDLDPETRQTLALQLLNGADKQKVEERLRHRLHRTTGRTLSYYARIMLYYAGLLLISPELELGDYDHARALSILGHGHAIQFDEVETALELAGEEGAFRHDLEYYFGETLVPFWPLLYVQESAFNQPVPKDWARFLSPDFVLRSVVGFGDRERGSQTGLLHFGLGHSWRDPGGMRSDLTLDNMRQYLHFFGESLPEHAAVAAYFRDRLLEAGASGEGAYSVYPFFHDDPEVDATELPIGMPLARYFPGVQQVLMASGFEEGGTRVAYRIGGPERGRPSIDFDTTHFAIYRDGHLALDSGSRAQTRHPNQGEGPCSNMNYSRQTVAHNAVLIHMPDEEFPGIESNSGGQRNLSEAAEPLAFRTTPYYAYAATDATGTYHEDKCEKMVRQLLFLPPDHVVVFDRVTSTNPEFRKSWLLHTSNEPRISETKVTEDGTWWERLLQRFRRSEIKPATLQFQADQDRGRIFSRTLLPRDAVLEKVGGPGKEFWADGRNWPVDPVSPWGPLRFGGDPDEVPEIWARWRVEVRPGSDREEDFFLHVLQTADQSVEEMTDVRFTDSDNEAALQFEHDGREFDIRFNKDGEVGGHITVREGGRTLLSEPLENTIQPQLGLGL